MTVDEYVQRLPGIDSMLLDNHIHADVAFFLARPMLSHHINVGVTLSASNIHVLVHNFYTCVSFQQQYDILRKADPNYKKMSSTTKQAKYVEAVRLVMAPVAESVKPLHPPKVWEDISPQFLVTFWSLSMYDLSVPVESYQREINKLKQLAATVPDLKEMVFPLI